MRRRESVTPPTRTTTSAESWRSGADGFDGRPAPGEQAIGDQPQRRDVDLASALVDEVDEARVNVGIFAVALGGPLGAVDEEARAAALEAKVEAVARADGDRPFLAFGPAPVEAGAQRAV